MAAEQINRFTKGKSVKARQCAPVGGESRDKTTLLQRVTTNQTTFEQRQQKTTFSSKQNAPEKVRPAPLRVSLNMVPIVTVVATSTDIGAATV